MRFTGPSLASQDGSAAAPAPAPGWTRLDWLVLSLVVLAAGALRFVRIGRPGQLVFDEIFYARNACLYVQGSEEACGVSPLVGGHPPLGELLIGAGIALFGFEPFGWRVAAAVAGTLTVALLYVLARRILGSTLGAVVAAGLLAIDFLHFVQSRIAMLDVFLTLFCVAAFLFAVLDRSAISNARTGLAARLVGSPWRLAGGAAGGAAAACKWSGALALIGVILLVLAGELTLRRRDGRPLAVLRTLRDAAPSIVVSLIVVPLVVYAATFAGRVDGDLLAFPWSPGSFPRAVAALQLQMGQVYAGITSHHPYESPAWSWLLLRQPVAYYFDFYRGDYQEILALGNPLVWWPSLAALAWVAYRWVTRFSATGPEIVIVVACAITFVPWLFAGGVRSAIFLFYILPTIPFLCLALAVVAVELSRARAGRVLGAAYAALTIGAFAFYYPILAAVPLSPPDWEARILFSDCDTGSGFRTLPDAEENIGPPPTGWCWR